MDTVGREELIEALNMLLEAERAGARVGAALVHQAKGGAFEALAGVIHDDEVRWSRALFEALKAIGAEPSDKVGDFYDRTMAIGGLEDRLAFVNRGQGWVARKLRELTPRLEAGPLRTTLEEMLEAHVVNIDAANRALQAASPSDR